MGEPCHVHGYLGYLPACTQLHLHLQLAGPHSFPLPLFPAPHCSHHPPTHHQIVNPGVGEGEQALEACLTPDAQYVLSGNPDRSIRAWSVASGAEVARWTDHAGVPTCLKVHRADSGGVVWWGDSAGMSGQRAGACMPPSC